jgi:flagellar secretion chaperone FliS
VPPSPLDRYRTDGIESLSNQRILVLLYQRLLADLDDAAAAVDRRLPAEAHLALIHAQDIVSGLRCALDHDAWYGATELDRLYHYLEGLLVRANVTKSTTVIVECRTLVEPLADAWALAYRTVSASRGGSERVLA